MRDPSRGRDETLSERVDALCDRFEAAWKAGQPPRLEDYLDDVPEGWLPELLHHLLALDLAYRVRRGEFPTPEDYRQRFPGQITTISALFRGRGPSKEESETGVWPPSPGTTQDATASGPVRAPDDPGPRLGRYIHLGVLGEGGMGTVHRVRDLDLNRDLALKVVSPRALQCADLVRRFLEEAQITSQLQHPGIPPVFELGIMPDGHPYYAMKLVQGRTLANLLKDRESPAEDLPRYIAIFAQVAQTVAYAHSQHVLHRDLKPANIMVGSFGEVQVMDWGLAKVTAGIDPGEPDSAAGGMVRTLRSHDPGAVTQAESVLGTYAYMPPEQARGELERVGPRADVFGLGATLCTILTGGPPYVETDPEVLRDRARRGDVGGAFRRLDASGADPELIALAKECLSADPADRPRDAGAVAQAMERYHQGVEARLKAAELARVSAETRAAEARKRRRWQAGLAGAILALAGLGAATWAWSERMERVRSMRIASAVREAGLRRDRAREAAIDPALWVAALEAARRAGDLLGEAADAPMRRQIDALSQETRTGLTQARAIADVLERATEIRSAQEDHLGGRGSDSAYASAFRTIGLDSDSTAADEWAGTVRDLPRAVALDLAAALDDWASLCRWQLGQDARARRLAALAGAIDPDDWRTAFRTEILQEGSRDRLEALKRMARRADLGALSVQSLTLLGRSLRDAGDAEASVSLLHAARRRHPGDVWINYYLGFAYFKMEPPQLPEAIRFLTAAQAVRPETAHVLGHALALTGRKDEAILVFQDLMRIRRTVGGHFTCLGELLKVNGRAREADEVLDRAVAASREALRSRPDDAFFHFLLGEALSARGDLAGAIAAYREGLRLKPSDTTALFNLGTVLQQKGDLDEALASNREVVRLNPLDAEAHSNAGFILLQKRQFGEAEAAFRRAVHIQPERAEFQNNLGVALDALGKLDEAEAAFRTALRLQPSFAEAHQNLGHVRSRRGDFHEAVAALRESLRLQPSNPKTLTLLGQALLRQDDAPAAAVVFRDLVDLQPGNAQAHCALGRALRRDGRLMEALAALRRGHALGAREPGWSLPSGDWIRECERRVEMERRLPSLLNGRNRAANAAECAQYAMVCYEKRLYVAGARLYREALAGLSYDAGAPRGDHRYNAACLAALAASGRGEGESPRDESARAEWRMQALAWLKADLAAWSSAFETGSVPLHPAIQRALQHCQADPDLASVRDQDALSRLPDAERKEWLAYWAALEKLLTSLKARSSP
jgi:serine/threonine-protein kinase